MQTHCYKANQLLSPASAGFLLDSLFNPEHGGKAEALSELDNITMLEHHTLPTLNKGIKFY
jgi:hypothetical protein